MGQPARAILVILATLLLAAPGLAQAAPVYVAPPLSLLYPVFQDHAVLQRDKPIIVWGDAAPRSHVRVTLGKETARATADAKGGWKATLHALPAGGPYELSAVSDAGQSQTVKDILIGDVFLCSGQSNMELPVRIASNYDADLNGAANPMIRLMQVHRFPAASPQSHFGADVSWAVTSPVTVREFSATCYYFGRQLQPHLGIPVGLINDSWGGTVIQAWLDTAHIRAVGGYETELAAIAHYESDKQGALRQWQNVTNAWWKAHDPGSAATPAWNDPAYDDSSWDRIIPAGDWEGWGVKALTDFDGTVWFRIPVTLTAAQAKGDAVLALGPVDDIDNTWVNGISIGGSEGWDTPRVYTLPAGTLHEGVNLIAVGVLDLGAGGGMWGPADAKKLTLADGTIIPLSQWRYRISAPLSQTGSEPHAPWVPESGLSMLSNGMIAPLGPLPIKAILWYQGEANDSEPQNYARLLTGLVEDWRSRFGPVPFLVVQLPDFGPISTRPENSNWAQLREAQRQVTDTLPNMGLAVTIDIGQRDNIHPIDKQAVGARLALLARQVVYGEAIDGSAPAPVSVTRDKDRVIVRFTHVGTGLGIYESNRALGFQLCNAAGQCRFVDAALENGDTVSVDAASMSDATLLRFCWSDSPICNLYDSRGLPAVPFQQAIAP